MARTFVLLRDGVFQRRGEDGSVLACLNGEKPTILNYDAALYVARALNSQIEASEPMFEVKEYERDDQRKP